jgi:DNA processing protein
MSPDRERLRRVACALERLGALRPATPDGALAAPLAHSGPAAASSRAAAGDAEHAAHDAFARAEALGVAVLLPGDAEFPAHLEAIPDSPHMLFACGCLDLLRAPGVAIVGSRTPTPYGTEACASVVLAAVAAGRTVVSGLARGIDAAAHREALLLCGKTTAVLGAGIDVVYPGSNRGLYGEVRRRGLIVTEYPPGYPPAKFTFVRRNRIIAGLSTVTVVVEAGAKSGALRTATWAQEQGHDVMSVPGPITSPLSVGCNRLLRDGATPFLEAMDLWFLLGVPRNQPLPLPRRPLAAILPPDLGAAERDVALRLADGERSLDELSEVLQLASHHLASALLGLELRGVVRSRPGQRFRLAEPWGAP